MASQTKRSRLRRIHHRIETECENEAEKEALGRRFDRMRQLLTPSGAHTIDNGTLLNAMFDIVERDAGRRSPLHDVSDEATVTQSFMRSSGECLALPDIGNDVESTCTTCIIVFLRIYM